MKNMKFILTVWIVLYMAGIASSQDYKSAIKMARDNFNRGQYALAAKICEEWLPVVKDEFGADDTVYLNLYELSGQCYYANAQYKKALQVFDNFLAIHKLTLAKPIYAADINNLAECYLKMENYDTALLLIEKAIHIRQEVLGTRHPDYARSLSDLADLYTSIGNYNLALPLYKEASSIDKDILGIKSHEYAADMSNLGMLYKYMENYDTALLLLKESVDIYKEILWTGHPDYALSLSNLAATYKTIGNYKAALPLYLEAKSIRFQASGTQHPDYAVLLNNLALLYIRMGNYEAALPLYKEALAIFREVKGPKDPDCARTLNNLASLFNRMGNNQAALPLYKEALSIYKEVLGNKHPDYATSLSNLALLYTDMGNTESALPLLIEATLIDKDTLGSKHPDYAADLINLANLYSVLGNYDTALSLIKEASLIYKQANGVLHPDYALSLNSLARLYRAMGNYETALPLLVEASSIYKEVVGTKNPDYATSLKNLGLLYKEMGNYEAALPLLVEVKNIRLEVLGANHPEYAFSLEHLAGLYIATGNYKTALPLMEEANKIINHNIQENFTFLTENEKKKYFSKIGNFYEVYLSFLKMDSVTSPGVYCHAYDNELLLKGLILTSVAGMQEAILESGDTSLTRRYEEMRVLKRQITAEQLKPILKRRVDLAEIELQSKELEEDLTRRSQTYGEMQSSFKIKWEDVQKRLLENEAAIEFVSFRFYNNEKLTDSTFYYAIVLRRNDPTPLMAYLCEESQLKKAVPSIGATFKDINSIYQRQALYNLLWHPIDSLLKDINTVYFAPSGLLNSVSLAAISGPVTKTLMEKYKLVQLTSTRMLVLPPEPVSIADAVVYGGIIYDTDAPTLLVKTEKYHKKETDLLAFNRSNTGCNRSGFRYLPNTEKEARMIASKLENTRIVTTIYSGTDAVEESFVALSGSNAPSIIHLSTHGFYYRDTMGVKNREKMMSSATGESRFRYSDDPLLRSGLLMAGANLAWKGLPLPPNMEDGILTAREVSNMNLTNTKLVVLSACQTGQGDVKGNEGVEGLQRGFKMAGARYLMMSLWEVPDKETAEFMETFYETWLGGTEIQEAFRSTQIAMRDKYKNDPFKWAAFVLVE